jgi:hypothetical protein
MERLLAGVSRLANRTGITIKTRRGLTTFAEALADDEIRYLHSVLLRAFVDGTRP